MQTIKNILFMVAMMAYFKVAFALGFGILWSSGALVALALAWWGLKSIGKALAGGSKKREVS